MSTNDQRLINDHKEVVQALRLYKNISLINTSGEPVDEYDIEYKVKGYTVAADGKVSISRVHRIKVKIPFGYPHFPPTIRPLSPIFHPEIDHHVVPIANYWEEHKSLPQLILHIGNMICGNYNGGDIPINGEAARYYEENRDKLPLDALIRIDQEIREKKKEPARLHLAKPLIYIAALCLIAAFLAGGGLFIVEKWRLGQAADIFAQTAVYQNDREFQRARETAELALEKLDHFYLLQSSGLVLREDIQTFLQSKQLLEGLRGNIKYGDEYISMERAQRLDFIKDLATDAENQVRRGEVQQALDIYDKAMEYIEKHDLMEVREKIHHDLANLRLGVLVAASERAHAGGDREAAIELHNKVLDFIRENEKFLPDEEKQVAKTRYLLLIDQIALYSREALEAENNRDYQDALQYHTMLIDIIGKADVSDNATLKDTLRDSTVKAAYLREKINIERKREWLLQNYKDIFQTHYPSILPATLRNPQALFVKYDEEKLVFDLSCLEKGSGTVVRLRIFYQYDPATQQWSLYTGEIDSAS